MAPVLISITHMKLSTGIFRGALSKSLTDSASILLVPLADHCPALQELSIDGDVGVELLQSFSATCPHLVSFVEVVNSLPLSTSVKLTQLMPRLAMRTVVFEVGNWDALIEAMQAVTTPTVFDLCGRTLLCESTMYVRGYGGLTLRNGIICVEENCLGRSAVICINDSGLHLEYITICGNGTQRFGGSGVSQCPGYDDDVDKSEEEVCFCNGWTGVRVCNGGSVVMWKCKVLGALFPVFIVGVDREFGSPLGSPKPSKFNATHCEFGNCWLGMGLFLEGQCCTADLTDCAITGSQALTIKDRSLLIAQRLRVTCTYTGLSVYESSHARMLECSFKSRSNDCVFVHGARSLVSLDRCFLDLNTYASRAKNTEVSEGGRLVVSK